MWKSRPSPSSRSVAALVNLSACAALAEGACSSSCSTTQRDTKRRLAEAKRLNQMANVPGLSTTGGANSSPSSPSRKRRLKELAGKNGGTSVVLVDPAVVEPLTLGNKRIDFGDMGLPLAFDRKKMAVSVSKIPADQKVLFSTTTTSSVATAPLSPARGGVMGGDLLATGARTEMLGGEQSAPRHAPAAVCWLVC